MRKPAQDEILIVSVLHKRTRGFQAENRLKAFFGFDHQAGMQIDWTCQATVSKRAMTSEKPIYYPHIGPVARLCFQSP